MNGKRRHDKREALLKSSADEVNVASHALDSGTGDSDDCFSRRGCLKRYTPNKTQLQYIKRLDDEQLQSQTKRNTLINSCKMLEVGPPYPPVVKVQRDSSRSELAAGCTISVSGRSKDTSLGGNCDFENLSNNAGNHAADRLEFEGSILGNDFQSTVSDCKINLIDGSKRSSVGIRRDEVIDEFNRKNPSDASIMNGVLDTWRCVLETGLDEDGIVQPGRGKVAMLSDRDILSLSVYMITRIVGLYFRGQEEMDALLGNKNISVKQILHHKGVHEEVYIQLRDEICQRVSKMMADVFRCHPSREGSHTTRPRDGTAPKVDTCLPGRQYKKRQPPAEALKNCLLGKSVNASLHLMRHKILDWLERDLNRFYDSKSWESELFPEFENLENPNHDDDDDLVNRVNLVKVKIETFQRFDPEHLLFKKRAKIVERRILDDAVMLSFKFLSDVKARKVVDDEHFEEMFSEIDEYVSVAVMKLVSGLVVYSRLNLKKYFESNKEDMTLGHLTNVRKDIESRLLPGLLRRCQQVLTRGLTEVMSDKFLLEESMFGVVYVQLLLHHALLRMHVNLIQAECSDLEGKVKGDRGQPVGGSPLTLNFRLNVFVKDFLIDINKGVCFDEKFVSRLESLGLDCINNADAIFNRNGREKEKEVMLRLSGDYLLRTIFRNILLEKLSEDGINANATDISRGIQDNAFKVDEDDLHMTTYLDEVMTSIDVHDMLKSMWPVFTRAASKCSKEAFERLDLKMMMMMMMMMMDLNHFAKLQRSLFSENSFSDDDDDDDDSDDDNDDDYGMRNRSKLPKEGNAAIPRTRHPPTLGKNAPWSNLSVRGGGDCRECHRWKKLSQIHLDTLHSLVAELEEGVLHEASHSVSRDLLGDLVRADERQRADVKREDIQSTDQDNSNLNSNSNWTREIGKDFLKLWTITKQYAAIVKAESSNNNIDNNNSNNNNNIDNNNINNNIDNNNSNNNNNIDNNNINNNIDNNNINNNNNIDNNNINNNIDNNNKDNDLIHFPDSSSEEATIVNEEEEEEDDDGAILDDDDDDDDDYADDDNFNDCNAAPGMSGSLLGSAFRASTHRGRRLPEVEQRDLMEASKSFLRGVVHDVGESGDNRTPQLSPRSLKPSMLGDGSASPQKPTGDSPRMSGRGRIIIRDGSPSSVGKGRIGLGSPSDLSTGSLKPPPLVKVQFDNIDSVSSSGSRGTLTQRGVKMDSQSDWSTVNPNELSSYQLGFLMGTDKEKEPLVENRVGDGLGGIPPLLSETQIKKLMRLTLMEENGERLSTPTNSSRLEDKDFKTEHDLENAGRKTTKKVLKCCRHWAMEHYNDDLSRVPPKKISCARSSTLYRERKKTLTEVGVALARLRTYLGSLEGSVIQKPKTSDLVTPGFLLPSFRSSDEDCELQRREEDEDNDVGNDDGNDDGNGGGDDDDGRCIRRKTPTPVTTCKEAGQSYKGHETPTTPVSQKTRPHLPPFFSSKTTSKPLLAKEREIIKSITKADSKELGNNNDMVDDDDDGDDDDDERIQPEPSPNPPSNPRPNSAKEVRGDFQHGLSSNNASEEKPGCKRYDRDEGRVNESYGHDDDDDVVDGDNDDEEEEEEDEDYRYPPKDSGWTARGDANRLTCLKHMSLLTLLLLSCGLVCGGLVLGSELADDAVKICIVDFTASLGIHCFVLEIFKVLMMSYYFTASRGRTTL